MTKVFSLLLTLTLVLGAVLGGAFAGGVALGKNQAPNSETSGAAGAGDGPRSPGQFNRERPGQGAQGSSAQGPGRQDRQGSPRGFQGRSPEGQGGGFGGRSRSGADSPEHQGFQGGPPDGPERRGFGGRGGRPGVSGTVAGIEGNQVTVTTPEGPITVQVSPETAFQKVTQATLEDVLEGGQIRVVGRPGDDGVIQARSITLVPEGVEAFPGRRDSQRSR